MDCRAADNALGVYLLDFFPGTRLPACRERSSRFHSAVSTCSGQTGSGASGLCGRALFHSLVKRARDAGGLVATRLRRCLRHRLWLRRSRSALVYSRPVRAVYLLPVLTHGADRTVTEG